MHLSINLKTQMLSNKFAIVLIGVSLAEGAAIRDTKVVSPTAIAADASVNYCFARVRGLDPERLPQAYLVLRLTVKVSYRNAGNRPLILPLKRARTVYTALKPGSMNVFKEGLGLFDPIVKPMEQLPPDVGPDSPIDPKNDVFAVIPAGGEMTTPLLEQIKM